MGLGEWGSETASDAEANRGETGEGRSLTGPRCFHSSNSVYCVCARVFRAASSFPVGLDSWLCYIIRSLKATAAAALWRIIAVAGEQALQHQQRLEPVLREHLLRDFSFALVVY